MAPAVATYEPRDPSRTVLYTVIAEHLETFLASLDADPAAKGLPAYVQREFYDYLQCGILAMAFSAWAVTPASKSCSCPSVASGGGFVRRVRAGGWPRRRPTWSRRHSLGAHAPMGGSVPIPLRYWMAASQDLHAKIHTIIRTTIGQYYVNQAVTRGSERAIVLPGEEGEARQKSLKLCICHSNLTRAVA